MSIKNEFDIYQEAFEKINWKESVAPVIRGVMLVEDSQVEAYNKIQKLLNINGMESCHSYLLDLDPSELTEAEACKVNNLYKLAQSRGFIEEDDADKMEDELLPPKVQPITVNTQPEPIKPEPVSIFKNDNAFTILYSAMRNGSIKTGEAFSNAFDTRAAKADVISKLERAGYQNISILAIEAGDPDAVGADTIITTPTTDEIPDYSEIDSIEFSEDDQLDNRAHNNHVSETDKYHPLGNALDPIGVKASTANARGENTVATSIVTPNDEQQEQIDVEEDDMLHNRHHNAHINEEDEDTESDDSDENTDNTDTSDEETDEDTETEDTETDDSTEDEETKEEDVQEPDEKLKADDDSDVENTEDEKDELTAAEKEQLKDSYKKAFKAAMQKCKFKTAFIDLSLEDKVKFFTELSKAWGDKADPSKFMTDKETEQLEKIIVKK